MIRNYLLLCCFGISAVFVAETVANVSIIGGQRAKPDQFPYQVIILFHSNFRECGGGIIGEQHIITAAHCVVRETDGTIDKGPITVHYGVDRRLNKLVQLGEVEKISVPTEYAPMLNSFFGDVAVLKLRKHINRWHHDHLEVLNLPTNTEEKFFGKTAVVAGFGWDWIKIVNRKEQGGNMDFRLKYAEAEVIRPGHKAHPGRVDNPKLLFAKVKQHDRSIHGTCTGDSGAPLVYENTVIGILSHSPVGCSEAETAAMYTNVAKYLDIIEKAKHDIVQKNVRTEYTNI